MLRNIPKNISPELMKALLDMGHGDEIVFGDANYPAHTYGAKVIHADGDSVVKLLDSILRFFVLDDYTEENVILMSVVPGKGVEPEVWGRYEQLIRQYDQEENFKQFSFLDRESFYERSRKAAVIVATGEGEKYANIILKMGVVEQNAEGISWKERS